MSGGTWSEPDCLCWYDSQGIWTCAGQDERVCPEPPPADPAPDPQEPIVVHPVPAVPLPKPSRPTPEADAFPWLIAACAVILLAVVLRTMRRRTR